MAENRIAEVAYSKEHSRLEVTLPYGSKTQELGKIFDTVFSRNILEKLQRGCPACHSGDHFVIRERLERVVRVDLDKRAIVE
jgi:hypothetical protein